MNAMDRLLHGLSEIRPLGGINPLWETTVRRVFAKEITKVLRDVSRTILWIEAEDRLDESTKRVIQ